jgi:hypothetical protein
MPMTVRVNDVRLEDLIEIIDELKGECDRVDIVVDDERRTVHIYPVTLKGSFKITDENIGDLL